jgi:hypothetical protein
VLKKNKVLNGKVRASINESISDSCSSCLKDRTSERRLTTLEMGKKCKQKLKHKASKSPYLFPIVSLYQRLAFSIKEKEKSSIVMSHLTSPQCVDMHRVAQTHLGGSMDFHHLHSKKIDPRPC